MLLYKKKLGHIKLDEVYFVEPKELENDPKFKTGPAKNLKKHFDKHVNPETTMDGNLTLKPMSIEQYNDLADKFSKYKCSDLTPDMVKQTEDGNFEIEGYNPKFTYGFMVPKLRDEERYLKYNMKNNLVIVYTKTGVISLYKQPLKKFLRKSFFSGKSDFSYVAPLPESEKYGG